MTLIHRGKSRSLTRSQRRWLKRRQAIEPAIGSGKSVPTVVASGIGSYTVRSTSKTGNAFTITKTNTGTVTRTCTAAAGAIALAATAIIAAAEIVLP